MGLRFWWGDKIHRCQVLGFPASAKGKVSVVTDSDDFSSTENGGIFSFFFFPNKREPRAASVIK